MKEKQEWKCAECAIEKKKLFMMVKADFVVAKAELRGRKERKK